MLPKIQHFWPDQLENEDKILEKLPTYPLECKMPNKGQIN